MRHPILGSIALFLAGLSACQSAPVARNDEGEPIYALSDRELSSVFRNVGVSWESDDPDSRPSSEVFYEDGVYVHTGLSDIIAYYRSEGFFWIHNGQLCRRSGSGDNATPWCAPFGRSRSGAIYQLPTSPNVRPFRYDLKPLPEDAVAQRKKADETRIR
jgi:hypothetical protein